MMDLSTLVIFPLSPVALQIETAFVEKAVEKLSLGPTSISTWLETLPLEEPLEEPLLLFLRKDFSSITSDWNVFLRIHNKVSFSWGLRRPWFKSLPNQESGAKIRWKIKEVVTVKCRKKSYKVKEEQEKGNETTIKINQLNPFFCFSSLPSLMILMNSMTICHWQTT